MAGCRPAGRSGRIARRQVSMSSDPRRRCFPATRWSVVRAAGDTASPEARNALAALCETCWAPVYAFIRQGERSADEAQDLTQAFFARLLEKRDFRHARHELGRFRTFLLTAVRHFLANQVDHERAAKRGGGQIHVPLGPAPGERTQAVIDPASGETPETVYEQRWALTVLEGAMARLQQQCVRAPRPTRPVRPAPAVSDGRRGRVVRSMRRRARDERGCRARGRPPAATPVRQTPAGAARRHGERPGGRRLRA